MANVNRDSGNKALIGKFYSAFQRKDAATMASCYHPEVVFEDPVFGPLHGERAGAMWKMLCKAGEGLVVEFGDVTAGAHSGSARWEAKYVFGATGRKVHNRIRAEFRFADGLIIEHTDRFDLKEWASMALGWKGRLLGGTAFFRKRLREKVNRKLTRFIEGVVG